MFIQPQGFLIDQEGGTTVSIYGLKELPLTKETTMNLEPVAMSTGVMSSWEGDVPVTFELNWDVTAGFQEAVATRMDLYDYVKTVQSWGAPSGIDPKNKSILLPPPKILLVIPGYVSCSGIVRTVSCTPKGPWDLTGGIRLPTSSSFSITFVPIKNYTVNDKIVNIESAARLSTDINQSFYQGG